MGHLFKEVEQLYQRFPFKLTELILCIPMAFWPPIRFLFNNHFAVSMTGVDFTIDFALGLFYFLKMMEFRKKNPSVPWGKVLYQHRYDLIVAFPWYTVAYFYPAGSISLMALFARSLMMGHALEIKNLLQEVDDIHPVAYRLIPILAVMPLVIHWVACGWIWLGSGTAGPSDDKVFEYIRAVYWAITTLATVGYGDISAKTPPQMALASVTMIIGVGFFGYVLSNVAGLLARMDAARDEYLNTIDRVESFMRYNQVPAVLRRKIRSYFRYLWDSRKGYDNKLIMDSLPQKLRAEVSLALNSEIVEKVPLFKGADQEMLQEIMLELEPLVGIPGEMVFHVGDPGESMYFIQRGQIEILTRDQNIVATLPAGSFFGEAALLTSNPRNASARSVEYSDLFLLRREAFEKVLHRHPSFEANVKKIADERLKLAEKKAS